MEKIYNKWFKIERPWRPIHLFPRSALQEKKLQQKSITSITFIRRDGRKQFLKQALKQKSSKHSQYTFSRTCSCFHPSFWLASPSIYSTHRHPDAWNGYWRTRGVAPSLTESMFYNSSFHRYGNRKIDKMGYVSEKPSVLLLKTIGFFVEDDFFWLIDSLIVSLLETGSHSIGWQSLQKKSNPTPSNHTRTSRSNMWRQRQQRLHR